MTSPHAIKTRSATLLRAVKQNANVGDDFESRSTCLATFHTKFIREHCAGLAVLSAVAEDQRCYHLISYLLLCHGSEHFIPPIQASGHPTLSTGHGQN